MTNSDTFDFRLAKYAVSVRRVPLDIPLRTSFGVMTDRPAVFVRVTDQQGCSGYGEVWCNFPSMAAEHRARIAHELVGPLLMAMTPLATDSPFDAMMDRMHVLALQSGEWGPFYQVASGFDAALFDLAARRKDLPLSAFLGGADARRTIDVYASGIGPEEPAESIRTARAKGHGAFKVKVGFGVEIDARTLAFARAAAGADAPLMADANQSWQMNFALAMGEEFGRHDLVWIEEPIAADRPLEEWKTLAAGIGTPLAGGENITRRETFDVVTSQAVFAYVQPDVAKWGGVSGCLSVARMAAVAGAVYCPHFLGAGVGLLASAHLLAARPEGGMLEMDVNPNPLRDELLDGLLTVDESRATISDRSGIGISPDALFD